MSEQNEIKALGDTLRTDWEEMKRQMEGSFLDKYKWHLVGGAVVLVGGFFLLKK